MHIRVDCSRSVGPIEHFWRGTGFTPAKLMLEEDMKQYLAYVGSIPYGGVTYVRIHYLLDLIRATGLRTESPVYDWRRLDEAIDLLTENNLKPFFELMGNPSGIFSDFCNKEDLYAWKRLVADLARHLIDRYGQEEVRSWYFETWNEPDAGWWHQWPQNVTSFCNYYDACVEGLGEVDSELTIGGPGSCRTLSPLFKGFIAHCDSGTNYFTKEKGVRLDFISVHEKGVRSSQEDRVPDTIGICEREWQAFHFVKEHHPRLAKIPFMNNECDPQVGWVDIHTWRAKPYYAALAVKIIDQHLRLIVDASECNYQFLNNDNGFMGTWGQRTHLTRFGDGSGTDRNRAQVSPSSTDFELIKKPVHNVMTLLALLGNERLPANIAIQDSAVGVIASEREDQIAVLVYGCYDDQFARGAERQIEITLENLPFEEGILVEYAIDERSDYPFSVWDKMGGPAVPNETELAKMRSVQELTRIGEPTKALADKGTLKYTLNLGMPGVALLLFSKPTTQGPSRVESVRAKSYRGSTTSRQTMLMWEGLPSRFLKTYEVLWSESVSGTYERVNKEDILCTAFLHVAEPSTSSGFYQVQAVDYLGRRGPASDPIAINDQER